MVERWIPGRGISFYACFHTKSETVTKLIIFGTRCSLPKSHKTSWLDLLPLGLFGAFLARKA